MLRRTRRRGSKRTRRKRRTRRRKSKRTRRKGRTRRRVRMKGSMLT